MFHIQKQPTKQLIIDSPDYQALATFFASDADSMGDIILEQLMLIQTEADTEQLFMGNVCSLDMSKDTVMITDELHPEQLTCAIDTNTFHDLLVAWLLD